MIQLMKNNLGDRTFEKDDDRYRKLTRCFIYFFVGFLSPFISLWMACKTFGEKKRIGDENVHL